MDVNAMLRIVGLSSVLLAGLPACATYDDTAMYGRCQESASVQDLPPHAAKRESRCDSLKVWDSDNQKGSDAPLDFSGRNKGD